MLLISYVKTEKITKWEGWRREITHGNCRNEGIWAFRESLADVPGGS
jgi:hypothetical protein